MDESPTERQGRMTPITAEHTRSPPPVSMRAARWLWPLLVIMALGALGLVVGLIDALAHGGSFRLDHEILLALRRPGHLNQPIGPAWLLQSAIDLSALGGFTLQWLLGAACLLFMLQIRQRAEAAWLAASILGASILNASLKSLLHRPRPELVPHLAAVSNASFPSGHAMISAAIYLTIGAMLAETQRRRSTRIFLMSFAGLLVLLIGISRIYLGVHWPSDVLAGWCLGTVWALAVFAVNRTLRARKLPIAQ
ncbi:phosphatase PAP2 family protein [Caulobacter sp. S45]|uniref:phosphatase PAP2 family protein n=1 Tax=Caulobacter sp. S45 TaxID=1641861 RepID=UPI001C20B65C|nr:phosphatase PAP2 family protein [Caulobacter sp. S45]